MAYSNDLVATNYIKQTGIKNNGSSCSYHGTHFWSYNTHYAELDTARNVLLIGTDKISSTTTKQHEALVQACISNNVQILHVPVLKEDVNFPSANTIVKRFTDRLDDYSKGTNLALSDYRLMFLTTLDRLKEYVGYAGLDTAVIEKYNMIAKNLDNVDFIKNLQKQRRNKI